MNKKGKIVEVFASLGLLLLCIGLIAPFATPDNINIITIFKWLFAVGAVMYTVSRLVPVGTMNESKRLKRLRHMLVWAGICFCVGAGFWFWNQSHGEYMFLSLGMMRDTVAFTLAGALIQIIGSWMVVSRARKEGLADFLTKKNSNDSKR